MILTCPQCATRYQADAAKFQPAGRNVRCAKCGHLWHQDPPLPESDASAEIALPEPSPPPSPPPAAVPPPPPPPRPSAFAPNPVIAREPVAVPVVEKPRGRSLWPGRLAVGAGWAGLIALILVIGWSALAFRRQIATVWPQSASLYAAMGMKTNAAGIDIQDVAYKRSSEAGQPVLAVTGKLANTSSRELPVPQIRVALIDNDNRELYHWTFVPGVMTLHPGQTAPFATRLSNPPEGARHFELRFAREGE